jgi:hypothetical protein
MDSFCKEELNSFVNQAIQCFSSLFLANFAVVINRTSLFYIFGLAAECTRMDQTVSKMKVFVVDHAETTKERK